MGGKFSKVRDAEKAINLVEEEMKWKTSLPNPSLLDAEIIASLVQVVNETLIPQLYGLEGMSEQDFSREAKVLFANYDAQERKVVEEISAKHKALAEAKADSELAESFGMTLTQLRQARGREREFQAKKSSLA